MSCAACTVGAPEPGSPPGRPGCRRSRWRVGDVVVGLSLPMACSTRTVEASLARFLTESNEGMKSARKNRVRMSKPQQPPMMAIQNQALRRGLGGGGVYAEDGSGAGGAEETTESSVHLACEQCSPTRQKLLEGYWRSRVQLVARRGRL